MPSASGTSPGSRHPTAQSTIHGAGSFYDPSSLVRDNTMITAANDPEYKPATYYYTDAISDHAAKFVTEHQRDHAEKPLFMYVTYTAAHWPMHALDEDIAKYRDKYDQGYDATRQARLEKARQLGLIDPKWELTPAAKSWADVENREWELRCMEVYAAMIDRMDRGIGQIVSALEKTQRLDNTLIFFLQDNGGCAEVTGRKANMQHPGGPRLDKPSLPPLTADFQQKGSTPLQTRDGYPVRMGVKAMPGPADTYIAYGEGWANVSNTPFREYKHWVHEGGISTPLIAHWPAGIKVKGELRKQPGHLIDIMATCVGVARAKYPTVFNGNAITPLEGRSLVPAFADQPLDRAIYWEHEGNRAVREGDWKLVAKGPAGKWELYNMADDRTEMHDLAAKHPDRAAAMQKQWEAYAERTGVLPWIWNPAYGELPKSE